MQSLVLATVDRFAALTFIEGKDASDQILEVMRRPNDYAQIVSEIRRHLCEKHSYAARLKELVRIVAE